MEAIRVLIAGDDPLARAGLAAILAGREELVVVAQVGLEALAEALAARAQDVVAWAPGAGAEPADALRPAVAAGVPVVAVVSGREQAAAALRAGARGIVQRTAEGRAIASALAAAAAGLTVLEPPLAEGWLRPPSVARDGEPLTPREREVLALLAEGLGNRALGARLGISENTARFHVNAILAKLGAESRAEAIVLAARQGLVVL